MQIHRFEAARGSASVCAECGYGPDDNRHKNATQRLANARAVLRKYDISEAQAHVLRDAVRKYHMYKAGDLHDGTVSTFNVREDTISILRQKGLIVREHKYTGGDRAARAETARITVENAFSMARQRDPFYPADNEPETTLETWRHVMKELTHAAAVYQSLEITVLRVTPKGHEVAMAWKQAIGAEEE